LETRKAMLAIKEEFRQERKQLKKDREEYFERKRAEARQRSGIGKPNFETRNEEPRSKIQDPTSNLNMKPRTKNLKPHTRRCH
jgi:hypothetical protein